MKINELGIELIDEEKIRKGIEVVNKKYAEDLKVGRFGGIGTGGIGDLFLYVSGFIVINIAPWALGHIFKDVDDWLWKKFKDSLIAIYKKAQSLKKDDKFVLKENPNVAFVFPLDLDVDIMRKELDKLVSITKKILADDPAKNKQYKYIYNSKLKTWELENSNKGSVNKIPQKGSNIVP